MAPKFIAIPARTEGQRGTRLHLNSLDMVHEYLPNIPQSSPEYAVIRNHLFYGFGTVVVVFTTPVKCDDCGVIGALEEGHEFGNDSDIPVNWCRFAEPLYKLCCQACAAKIMSDSSIRNALMDQAHEVVMAKVRDRLTASIRRVVAEKSTQYMAHDQADELAQMVSSRAVGYLPDDMLLALDGMTNDRSAQMYSRMIGMLPQPSPEVMARIVDSVVNGNLATRSTPVMIGVDHEAGRINMSFQMRVKYPIEITVGPEDDQVGGLDDETQ